ncbi:MULTISPECIES: hypothetical protein [Rhizobium]|uniref:hypothetical protein n=1 Tax=Rhizobium phaseoli TaxID=396 RepID=UPI000A1C08E0|nr:hypothetical protein [Rhizobium phaseoli]ARM12107.1 hypothetical protein Bra5_CH01870 [Rhizobium phaseoli Brasil 5]
MQPEIDRARFARDVRKWLAENKLSTRDAQQAHPGLNPAMISRACREDVLSAASMLALCAAMKRDPTTYLTFLDKRNQTVTANVSRETRGAA